MPDDLRLVALELASRRIGALGRAGLLRLLEVRTPVTKILKPCPWEAVRGFVSPGEYDRFVRYIEAQVGQRQADEVPANPAYGAGEIYGGRWFRDRDSGQVWRLVAPDFPFKGLWEPVST